MNDQNAMYQASEARYRKFTDPLPSVKFYHLESFPAWLGGISRGAISSEQKITQVDISQLSKRERAEWVANFLKEHHIAGKYLFQFSTLPLALVDLSDSYDWVEPLWFPSWEPGDPPHSTNFNFVTTDHEQWLKICWSEQCMSNDCYDVWTAQKPSPDDLIKILYENRLVGTQIENLYSETVPFKAALEILEEINLSEQYLPDLLKVFSNEVMNAQPYEALMAFIWSFDKKAVVHAIVEYSQTMNSEAPYWLRQLYLRVVADTTSSDILKDNLRHITDENRHLIQSVLASINQTISDDLDRHESK